MLSNLLKQKTAQGQLMRKVKAEIDPDFNLVEKSRSGDAAAFEELLSRHYARTRALIFRLTGADRVDDLTQESFLLAYKNIRRFRGEATFSTWLTRIAVNLCRSEWRKHKRERECRSAHVSLEELQMANTVSKSGSQAMMDAEKGERIDSAIEALPPRLRIVFTLRYIQGHSSGEVAAIVGCKEGTVRSRLFNARETLRVRLKELVK